MNTPWQSTSRVYLLCLLLCATAATACTDEPTSQDGSRVELLMPDACPPSLELVNFQLRSATLVGSDRVVLLCDGPANETAVLRFEETSKKTTVVYRAARRISTALAVGDVLFIENYDDVSRRAQIEAIRTDLAAGPAQPIPIAEEAGVFGFNFMASETHLYWWWIDESAGSDRSTWITGVSRVLLGGGAPERFATLPASPEPPTKFVLAGDAIYALGSTSSGVTLDRISLNDRSVARIWNHVGDSMTMYYWISAYRDRALIMDALARPPRLYEARPDAVSPIADSSMPPCMTYGNDIVSDGQILSPWGRNYRKGCPKSGVAATDIDAGTTRTAEAGTVGLLGVDVEPTVIGARENWVYAFKSNPMKATTTAQPLFRVSTAPNP